MKIKIEAFEALLRKKAHCVLTTRGGLKQYKQLNRLVSNGKNLLLYQKMGVQQQSLRQSIPTNQMTSFLHSAYLEYTFRILDLEDFKIYYLIRVHS